MKRLLLSFVCLAGLLGPTVPPAAAGTVEGTVTPIEWAQEVEVCVAQSQVSEICTAPQADGSYVLGGVPPGGVRIEFTPSYRSGLLRQFYDGKSELSEAKSILLTPENPTVSGIDAALLEGGAIEGTATAASGGEPLAEVEVCAISVGPLSIKICGDTDPDGTYQLHSLPSGTYAVEFWGQGKSAEYQPLSQQGVDVTAGKPTMGVDAALAKGAGIQGVVTAAAGGRRLPDITVCLFSVARPSPLRCTYSDEVGSYSFTGLTDGSYQVGFSPGAAELGGEGVVGEGDGFEPQYYDQVQDRAMARTISVLAPTLVEGVDAALVAPPEPTASPPPPAAAASIVDSAQRITEPMPRKVVCRKGYRKKKVKGKTRCVKTPERKALHHHRRKRKRKHRHNRDAVKPS